MLMDNIGRYIIEALRNWNPKMIKKKNTLSNKDSHAIYFFLNSILGGYIEKFALDCTQYYSVAKRNFLKGYA
jgi:hypothetical protein